MGLFSTARIDCPCCGERIELDMDTPAGSQDCIEDARPAVVRSCFVGLLLKSAFRIEARRDDE